MIRSDMPTVLEIEKCCYESPWSEEDFIRCLRQRNCIGMVIEHKDQVVGYMIYELHKSHIELLNIAVVKSLQCRGLGAAMVGKLRGKLSDERRCRILVDVWEHNLAAQLFFKSLGFVAHGFVRDRFDGGQDAIQFIYGKPMPKAKAGDDGKPFSDWKPDADDDGDMFA
ncbi:MAG: ribosomal-protein-alanine N-acetyltransferase RimI [Porticoccaceae bacterium]|nr:ribosomal-protein-alanine N-acetyltransferase RimI [Porticoccaceae bacterium]